MLKRANLILLALLLAVGILAVQQPALAGLGSLKDKVKNKVERKVDKKTDKAIDDAIDGAEDAAEGKGDDSQKKTDTEQGAKAAGGDAATKLKPGEGAWLNYDFIPGDKVLYYEDFANSPVGDFPQHLEFVEGNMEVAEWEGARYLRVEENGKFEIPLPENLPENFTVEMQVYLPQSHSIYISEGSTAPKKSNRELYKVGYQTDRKPDFMGGLRLGGKYIADGELGQDVGFVNARIMISGKYAKVYANEKRLANVPNADIARANRLLVEVRRIDYRDTDPVMIGSIRVAEGGKKILYDELSANGRVATQGIYFDSGSDRLRPESTPTLSEIGEMLKAHNDLRLRIEGHTDNVGEADYNLDLSSRRAAAVKAYLVETYGIDGARLETEGFGETKPVDTNDSPEGRQNNRRVELVKLS